MVRFLKVFLVYSIFYTCLKLLFKSINTQRVFYRILETVSLFVEISFQIIAASFLLFKINFWEIPVSLLSIKKKLDG